MVLAFIVGSLFMSYLIGSIPTSVWVGKSWHGIDIREHGSGNAGATNTFRVLGRKAGIFVMTVDIIKGTLATTLPVFFPLLLEYSFTVNDIILLKIGCGVFAVLGHIFPIYAKFKGGKGVATLLGMVIAVNYEAAAICVGVFLIILIITKYVSLGSMLAALVYPIINFFPFMYPDKHFNLTLVIFGFAIFIMVVYTHKKNIKRLLEKNENKTYLFGKPKE